MPPQDGSLIIWRRKRYFWCYRIIILSWWHGSLTAAQNNLNDLASRYGKDIIIVETAYPWTSQYVNDGVSNVGFDPTKLPAGYPVNSQGQRDFLTYLSRLIKNTTSKKGIGFFYWEPADISVSPVGSAWENYAMFDFSGNAFNSLQVFQNSDTIATSKVTIRVNTASMATLWKVRVCSGAGTSSGVSSGFLPSGEKIAWDATSQVVLTNIGGIIGSISFRCIRRWTTVFALGRA